MTMISKVLVACAVALALSACGEEKDEGDSSEEEQMPGPGEPEAEPESEPAAEPEAAEPDSEPAPEPDSDVPPEPPTMEAAEPLTGDLHVTWSLPDSGCDMIELLRNEDGGEFESVFTLTGAAESQHDSSADPGTEYCYRARCIKGGVTSEESNEVCGSP